MLLNTDSPFLYFEHLATDLLCLIKEGIKQHFYINLKSRIKLLILSRNEFKSTNICSLIAIE